MKLGEIPSEQGNPATARVIDAPSDGDLETWLEKIQRTWNGPNQLEIDLPSQPQRGDRQGPAVRDRPLTESKSDDVTTSILPDRGIARPVYRLLGGRHSVPLRHVAEEAQPADSPGSADPAATVAPPSGAATPPAQPAPGRPPTAVDKPPAAPPIKISRAPDGRLIITCQDPVALDRLESLMLEFPPPRKEYEVFRLKYADATYTAMDLKDFFQDETEGRRRGGFFFDPWDYYERGNDSSKPSRLSKRKPLKFIAQIETNSILVQGATPAQLETVRDLITNVFDRRDPVDTKLMRSSRAFTIQYSKAQTVAETIKEVYRDLLSANDKSLQNNQRERTERIYSFNYGDSGPKKFQFKGALSIGVDEMSNTLLVSTSPRLMDEVSEMIEYLDQAARPTTTVEVLNTGLGVNGEELQRTLARMLSERSRGGDRSRRSSEGRSRDGRNGRDGRSYDRGRR